MASDVGGRLRFPVTLKPFMDAADEAYQRLQAPQDAMFFEDEEVPSGEEAFDESISGFLAGAVEAGLDSDAVTVMLRQRYPHVRGGVLWQAAPGDFWNRPPDPESAAWSATTFPEAPVAAATAPHAAPQAAGGFYGQPVPLTYRYTDAYRYARWLNTWGSVVKVVAFVYGGFLLLTTFQTLSAASSYGGSSNLGGLVVLSALVGAVVGTAGIWISGMLLCAASQFARALIDTAINTSPLLEKDDVARIMSTT